MHTAFNVQHNLNGQKKNIRRLFESGLMTATGAAAVPLPIVTILGAKFTCRATFEPPADPSTFCQRLHWVRHGEGFHNLVSDLFNASTATRPNQIPEMRDPPLTEQGRKQARILRGIGCKAALVVSSPMHRAMQTAVTGFPSLKHRVPWVVRPEIREKHHGGDWDGTRDRELSEEEFDWCDWSACPETDPMPLAQMELDEAVRARGAEFIKWLCQRHEKEVVVATHSAFLFSFLNLCVRCDGLQKEDVNPCYDPCELTSELRCPWFLPGECKSMWIDYVPHLE